MSQSAVGEEGAAAPFDASTPDFSEIRDWFALLKPRVMTLVVFTGFIGMLVAPGSINPLLGSVAVLCIAVGAGAAGAINMWYDRDIDAVMRRTANRPIPAGRIRAEEALAFGVVLAIASVVVMGLATNWMAAGWLAGSILFYVFVYTMWLKRRTPQNIVIGGAAGAFPPVIGWAAVTGSVDLLPLLLFAIVFAWTPPHFWSLSLWAHGDYQRAGVPMLPVVAGAKETRRQIMLYTLVLFPLAVSPWPLGLAGPIYGVAAVLLGLGFVFCAWKVLRDDQDPQGRSLTKDAPAKRCFRFSLLHLALLFAALAADRLILG
ncbi:Protoheme IX farnesyltransferase [Roseomonas mucosa]|uniref:Protoheme IX farnesyltransferase n=1 Tax=Roseomonas mucosa TaxID=207340 RepID=A0A1S8CZY3_9PROT|nr:MULTISPECIES: heme o synthase [Roseomonas]ATR21552.1 protoheme IX farnesyltransferase [Roseomonas sp. FDAARGOS_362]ONH81279.1 protoheme IX farnesyltransferase [Roseomonas mucosa]UZO96058.1 Protoheme IX farnesyltransferase [Roseomonas mucosa]GAV34090.1 protoheme IX farnesyltransferase [Roseomonas sp. TAS13]